MRDRAIVSLIENAETLYPIFSSILTVVKDVFLELSSDAKASVANGIIALIKDRSHVMNVELNLAYAVRVIAEYKSAATQEILVGIYGNPKYSALVRRDVILAMTKLGAWPWLSDQRISFRAMSPPERRAFIIASFALKDEGRHWRENLRREFSPLEKLVRDWRASKTDQPAWVVPL